MLPATGTTLCCSIFLAFYLAGFCASQASSAEAELTLLTLEGDLIGRIEALDADSDSEVLIQAYYALLLPEIRLEAETLHTGLIDLIPNYEVAFIAADSAEITEVKFDIDVLWAGVRTLHALHFTREVAELLDTAYNSAFSTLDLKPANTEAE